MNSYIITSLKEQNVYFLMSLEAKIAVSHRSLGETSGLESVPSLVTPGICEIIKENNIEVE